MLALFPAGEGENKKMNFKINILENRQRCLFNQNNNNPNKKELRAWCRDKYGSAWFENGLNILNKVRLKEARVALTEVGAREEQPVPPPPYDEVGDDRVIEAD